MALLTAARPPATLSATVLAAAEVGDTATTLAAFDAEGYTSIDTRSLYQSTLLHTAAKHGHVELARELLRRGANINNLDFGGMRRSPLHWACQRGYVAVVELLVDSGADTTADGRSWSKLVQGSRCGRLIPRDQPTESVESVCHSNAVRLALVQPTWQPSIHAQWPERFRDAARMLLLACSCRGIEEEHAAEGVDCGADPVGCTAPTSSCSCRRSLPLSRDLALEVLRRAAYPISVWM